MLNIVGPLPRTPMGNSYILSISDCFSKFTLLFPLRKAEAVKITSIFEEQILLFAAPVRVITDNGVQFRSKVFQEKAKEYNIKICYTANYYSQANPVETTHRVVKTMLTAYVKDKHQNWDKYLPKVAWALRSATHEVTGLVPNFVFFGRQVQNTGTKPGPLITPDNDGWGSHIRAEGLKQVFRDISTRLVRAYECSRKTFQ